MRTPKPKDIEKNLIIAGIGIILVVVLVLIFAGKGMQVGEAFRIGESPVFDEINLVEEKEIVFTIQPTKEGITIPFLATTSPLENPTSYTMNLKKLDDTTYQLVIDDIIDIIDTTNFDSTTIHLDNDGIADLGVTYAGGNVTITNLHRIEKGQARIVMQDGQGIAYPRILQLSEGGKFSAIINASTEVAAPSLKVLLRTTDIPLTQVVSNATYNFTQGNFSFIVPSSATGLLLDIKATAGNRETHSYYHIAVGDVVYTHREFPKMGLELKGQQNILRVEWVDTDQLQGVGFPCEILKEDAFGDTLIDRVYSWDSTSQTEQSWIKPAPTSDITTNPFQGYFVKIDPFVGTEYAFTCNLQTVRPVRLGDSTNIQQLTFNPGWHLISLPGLIPQRLTDFTLADDFSLFICTQGQRCNLVSSTQKIDPSQAYWLFVERSFTIRYVLE